MTSSNTTSLQYTGISLLSLLVGQWAFGNNLHHANLIGFLASWGCYAWAVVCIFLAILELLHELRR